MVPITGYWMHQTSQQQPVLHVQRCVVGGVEKGSKRSSPSSQTGRRPPAAPLTHSIDTTSIGLEASARPWKAMQRPQSKHGRRLPSPLSPSFSRTTIPPISSGSARTMAGCVPAPRPPLPHPTTLQALRPLKCAISWPLSRKASTALTVPLHFCTRAA